MTGIPIETRTVDLRTGTTTVITTTEALLMPAPPGTCPECATAHDPDAPHNAQSLFYQYSFFARRGRWPDWRDAVQHCAPDVRQAWTDALTRAGINVEQGELAP